MLRIQNQKPTGTQYMSKAKYFFHEIKEAGKVPDDANAICITALDKIDPSGESTKFFKERESKKLYGTLNVMSPVTNRVVASFEMHNGIVKMFKLIEFLGNSQTHFYRTVLNDAVSFERKGKHNEKTV